jgi:hypothetical protein
MVKVHGIEPFGHPFGPIEGVCHLGTPQAE